MRPLAGFRQKFGAIHQTYAPDKSRELYGAFVPHLASGRDRSSHALSQSIIRPSRIRDGRARSF